MVAARDVSATGAERDYLKSFPNTRPVWRPTIRRPILLPTVPRLTALISPINRARR